MIDWLLHRAAAKWHQWRVRRDLARVPPEGLEASTYHEWRSLNPGRCMYCAYTRWANEEMGQSLKLEAHNCVEGNGPPMPLPKATARKP